MASNKYSEDPTFEELFRDPMLMGAFTKFTEREFSSENINFINSVVNLDLKKLMDLDFDKINTESLSKTLNEYYATYIADNAKEQVNISGVVRAPLDKYAAEGFILTKIIKQLFLKHLLMPGMQFNNWQSLTHLKDF